MAENDGKLTILQAPDGNGSPVTGFEYSQDGGEWKTVPGGAVTPLVATIPNLTPASDVDMKVRAVNAAGPGPDSNTKTITIPGTPPGFGFDFALYPAVSAGFVGFNDGTGTGTIDPPTLSEPGAMGAEIEYFGAFPIEPLNRMAFKGGEQPAGAIGLILTVDGFGEVEMVWDEAGRRYVALQNTTALRDFLNANAGSLVALDINLTPPASTRALQFFHNSKAAFDSYANGTGPDEYDYWKGGYQLQFYHGGARSPVDPNIAAFIQDVGLAAVTENAESDHPVYRHMMAKGTGTRMSVALMFSPYEARTWIYATGEVNPGTNGGQQGLYKSRNLGLTSECVLEFDHIWSGTADGYRYRRFRPLLAWSPINPNRWLFLNPIGTIANNTTAAYQAYLAKNFGVWRSGSHGDKGTWAKVSSDPVSKRMGFVTGIQWDYGQANTVWAYGSTGLWKSTDAGAGWNRAQANLPAGDILGVDFNPNNPNDFYVCVYDVGVFRTLNGGASFNQVNTPHNRIGQIFVSNADRNHMWALAIHLDANMNVTGRPTLYSTNGGATWAAVDVFAQTYGWDRGWVDRFVINGRKQLSTQSVILPSPTDPDRFIATAMTTMWRSNDSKTVVNESRGLDTLAGSESNINNIGFSKGAVGSRWIVTNHYDHGVLISKSDFDYFEDNGTSGYGGNSAWGASVSPDDRQRFVYIDGTYNAGDPTTGVLLSRNGGASSFRPADLNFAKFTGYVQFDPTNGNFCYSQHAISLNAGENWQRWADRDQSGVFQAEGCVAVSKKPGVQACSPANGAVLWATNGDGKLLISKNRGLGWRKVVNSGGPEFFAVTIKAFWPDTKDPNVCYWWADGVGIKKYDDATGNVTIHSRGLAGKRIQRMRQSYQDPKVMYVFDRTGGVPQLFESRNGVDGPWRDLSTPFEIPMVISNKSIDIDPDTGILFVLGTIGTHVVPPPGGHPMYDKWSRIQQAVN